MLMSFLKYGVRFLPLLLAAGLLPAQHKIQAISPAAVSQQAQFNIYLPLQNAGQLDQLLVDLHSSSSPNYRHWLTPAQFRQQFGPSPTAVSQIAADLKARGLTVVKAHSHGLTVQGNVGAIQALVGSPLSNGVRSNGTRTLVTTAPHQLPALYVQAGAHVASFSPVIRQRPHSVRQGLVPANRYSTTGPYWFTDLKEAYDFPSYQALNGRGRTIAVLMSCDFLDSDMAAYFGHEKLAVPKTVRVLVDGGAPFDPNSDACFESALDMQQAGGMAPGATIMEYNIPDLSDQHILDGYAAIIDDNVADIVTSSFGGPEGFYTPEYNGGEDFTWILGLYDDVFKQGNAQGITFLASSGDEGGLPIPSLSYFTATPQDPPVIAGQFLPGVESPASDPHVTAVGGTNLVTTHTTGSLDTRYVRENANYDPLVPYDPYGVGNLASGGAWQGGGGVSIVFPKPPYQRLVRTGFNMRTVPDISFQMGGCPGGISQLPCGPDRSYVLTAVDYDVVHGYYGLIGTSVSSPDMAGIIALAEQNLGGVRLGNVNYFIYGEALLQPFYRSFHQGIPGNNGYFNAPGGVPGYNLVLGNGTPDVRKLVLAPFDPPAGTPQTPSNP
jgi:subtilase family serine protease